MAFYRDFGIPFLAGSTRKYLDIAYWVIAVIFLVGDFFSNPRPFTFFTALTLLKPIPIFLIAAQVWPVKDVHSSVLKIFVGLVLGAVGDILLLINDFVRNDGDSGLGLLFVLGIVFFLIGNILYTISFLEAATDGANGHSNLAATLSHKLLYIVIWTFFVGLTLYVLTYLATKQDQGNSVILLFVLFGAILLLLVASAFFYYFSTRDGSELIGYASLFAVIGAVSLFFSELFFAENNFNPDLASKVKWISLLNVLTYYIGQFFVGKSAVQAAAHFIQRTRGTPI